MTIPVLDAKVAGGTFVEEVVRHLLIDEGGGVDVQVLREVQSDGQAWLEIRSGLLTGWVPKKDTQPHVEPPRLVDPPKLAYWATDGVQVWGGERHEFIVLGELESPGRRGYYLRSGDWLLMSESTEERQYWIRHEQVETGVQRMTVARSGNGEANHESPVTAELPISSLGSRDLDQGNPVSAPPSDAETERVVRFSGPVVGHERPDVGEPSVRLQPGDGLRALQFRGDWVGGLLIGEPDLGVHWVRQSDPAIRIHEEPLTNDTKALRAMRRKIAEKWSHGREEATGNEQPAASSRGGLSVSVIIGLLVLAGVCCLPMALLAVHASHRRRRLTDKYGDVVAVEKILGRVLWVGETAEQVQDSFGRPVAVDQKVLKTKVKETWKYAPTGRGRFAVRITLDDGIVVGWDVKR
ncbi:MAG: hypothetical protein AAF533_19010 [Acidobacteriota bacterium]